MNYSVGYDFGRHLADLKRHGQNVDLEMVFRGVLDAIGGPSPRVTFKDMRPTLDELSKAARPGTQPHGPSGAQRFRPERGLQGRLRRAERKTRRRHRSCRAAFSTRCSDGGSGPQPKAGDTVSVNYKATLPTGVQFDSTDESGKPADFKIAEIAVPGLKDALLLMKEGDKWRVVIPARLGFQRAVIPAQAGPHLRDRAGVNREAPEGLPQAVTGAEGQRSRPRRANKPSPGRQPGRDPRLRARCAHSPGPAC